MTQPPTKKQIMLKQTKKSHMSRYVRHQRLAYIRHNTCDAIQLNAIFNILIRTLRLPLQQPTAEQIRIAQITEISTGSDDPKMREKVASLMETTQRTEEDVCCALYECDNDLDRAVIFLFESLPVVSRSDSPLFFFVFKQTKFESNDCKIFEYVMDRAHSKLHLKRRKIDWLEPMMQRPLMVNGSRAIMRAVRIITRTTTVTFVRNLATVAVMLASDVAIPIVVDGEAENLGKMTATSEKIGLVKSGRAQIPVHVVIHQVHSVAVAAAVAVGAVAMARKDLIQFSKYIFSSIFIIICISRTPFHSFSRLGSRGVGSRDQNRGNYFRSQEPHETVDTWDNTIATNAVEQNKSDDTWGDWDNEEYTGSLADTKVFTPSSVSNQPLSHSEQLAAPPGLEQQILNPPTQLTDDLVQQYSSTVVSSASTAAAVVSNSNNNNSQVSCRIHFP